MRRASLRANYFVRLPHLLPDLNRRTIHIEESHLLTTLPTETVDADSPQEACLPGPDQVWCHADCRCILYVLHVLGALRNDLIVRNCRGVL